ncbi:major facilitator superfamily domain-containing protein [Vararia minispora EC-137]|uniref:Major facilitator superfamily domain-containing protein n=1 Tax=Vararia minispora EC-137 TaxID=1314806 RepID=A0ACB8Q7U2_9AGAM|nr:major facilitator superfamily domain-containing protein [Vararia minispora EC-137]
MSDIEDRKSLEPEVDVVVSSRSESAAVSAAYEAKSNLINECMQREIGFGWYQFNVFMLTGLGWAADNIWLQGVAIILPQIQTELNPVHVEYATLALFAGLIVGATLWGILADIIGRRLSFNITLFIAGVFGIAAGGAPNFVAIAALISCIGFGVGAIFLEVVPQSHQWLLTLLSAWWALGQLFASLVAWPFIAHYSCPSGTVAGQCPRDENMGWRYTFGAVTFAMFISRFFLFDLQESAKYLVANGRDEEAIRVLEHIARKNGKTITLTVEKLQAVGGKFGEQGPVSMSLGQTVRHSLRMFSLDHIKPLFASRKLAVNTALTILLWGLIGLAYPLFNGFITLYLQARAPAGSDSTAVTYRNYSIISVLGIPGSIIAAVLVDWTRKDQSRFALGGRKLAMALSTALNGIFLFLFTTATSQSAILGYNCASSLTANAMYGVLYAYTPEVFPAPHRGTGDALASAFNRIMGLIAPLIKIATTSGSQTTATANGHTAGKAAL